MYELKLKARAIADRCIDKYGKKGSLRKGYLLLVDGEPLMKQPIANFITCGMIYGYIEDMLIENNISEDRIEIQEGQMYIDMFG